jgi:hypothetical protein
MAKTGGSFYVAVFAAMISMSLVCNPTVTAQTSSAQAPKKAATIPAALTPDQREAQKHYRIALEALKDNDFVTAADELTAASKLAPKNALIWYNLAVVESKKGDSAQSALDDFQKAISLGLPKTMKNDADELEAKLSYEVKKEAKKQALSQKLLELQKEIKDLAGGQCRYDNDLGYASSHQAESYSYDLSLPVASVPRLRIHEKLFESSSDFTSLDTSGNSNSNFTHQSDIDFDFDLPDLAPDVTISDPDLGICGATPQKIRYRLKIGTNRSGAIRMNGSWRMDDSRKGHQEGSVRDGDELDLYFLNKDSADRVAQTFSELIQMIGSVSQGSTDKR